MNNTGNKSSYSGTSTFRGFQHPRLLSGSEEPSDQEKPYGPKPIYYPVSMQKNTMDLASFNVPPPSPPMPYMMPPQQSQPKKPSIQYICNRGQRTTAPSAPVVAAAPPAAAAPACSSCGQQTCAPSCRHKSYDKDRARQKIKKIEQRWEQKWEQEWEQEWSREKEQKKQEKKEKKAAKKRATPTPVVPYTSNLLAPTGLGMVPSLMAAYGFTQMSAVAPPISAVQPTAAAAAAAAPAASGLGQNLPYPYQYGGYGPPAQQQQPQQPQQKSQQQIKLEKQQKQFEQLQQAQQQQFQQQQQQLMEAQKAQYQQQVNNLQKQLQQAQSPAAESALKTQLSDLQQKIADIQKKQISYSTQQTTPPVSSVDCNTLCNGSCPNPDFNEFKYSSECRCNYLTCSSLANLSPCNYDTIDSPCDITGYFTRSYRITDGQIPDSTCVRVPEKENYMEQISCSTDSNTPYVQSQNITSPYIVQSTTTPYVAQKAAAAASYSQTTPARTTAGSYSSTTTPGGTTTPAPAGVYLTDCTVWLDPNNIDPNRDDWSNKISIYSSIIWKNFSISSTWVDSKTSKGPDSWYGKPGETSNNGSVSMQLPVVLLPTGNKVAYYDVADPSAGRYITYLYNSSGVSSYFSNAFTYEFWCCPKLIKWSTTNVIKKPSMCLLLETDNNQIGVQNDTNNAQIGFVNGEIRVGINDGTTSTYLPASNKSVSYDTNKWYHIVETYDSSTKTLSFYINGKLIDSKNNITKKPIKTQWMTIGMQNSGYSYLNSGSDAGAMGFFNGYVGAVRMYQKALTPDQILGNYNAEVASYTYKLNLNNCITWLDTSNGVGSGGKWFNNMHTNENWISYYASSTWTGIPEKDNTINQTSLSFEKTSTGYYTVKYMSRNNMFTYFKNGFGARLSASYSYEIWCQPQPNNTTTSMCLLLENNQNTIGTTGWAVPQIAFISTTGKIRCGISTGANGATISYIDSNTLYNGSTTTWYHIGVTYDSTTNLFSMYINGKLESSNTFKRVAATTQWLTIGMHCKKSGILDTTGTAGLDYFNGNVGNVRFHTESLTVDEMKNNYNAECGLYGLSTI